MIKHLSIKNYAIIEELELVFSNGLTIITGETGAGKSILLGALGLIMGKRADSKTLYNEKQKCIIEGVFDVAKYDIKAFFENYDLDEEEALLVRREISPSGKSRAFINDTPVKLKALQELSSELIDLHQQFDTLDLNEISVQLKMLDALADNKVLLGRYLKEYKAYVSNKKKLAKLEAENLNALKEADYIQFQLKELLEAQLEVGEQEELEEELARLNNAEDIKKNLIHSSNLLNEEGRNVLGQLDEISQLLYNFRDIDKELASLYERIEASKLELQDLHRELENKGESIEYDPQRIEEAQARLDQLYRLQNKHLVNDLNALIEVQSQLQDRINSFDNMDAAIKTLKQEIEAQEAVLIDLAKELSERRKSVVPPFESKIKDRLALLAMQHAQLKVSFNVLKDLGPSGWDEVRFLFSANKGAKLQEIKEVASGGELSRLALVTKSLVASAIPLPTLIFDEIDSGISGDVALKMGNILRTLSDEHQVVCITHSPQIASKADSHFFVYKKEKADRTVTKVKALDQEGKIKSIAIMLSQDPPSESALENARELINKN